MDIKNVSPHFFGDFIFILKKHNMDKEFGIGAKVTLDRYNHIEDVQKVEVIGYGEMPISKTLTYKMDVNGVIIESTGISIMESKHYIPAPDTERHCRINATVIEREEYWDKIFAARKK